MTDSELQQLAEKAMAAFNAMTPEQQAEHRKAQMESWVRGEMAMGLDKDEAAYRAKMKEQANG